MTKVKN